MGSFSLRNIGYVVGIVLVGVFLYRLDLVRSDAHYGLWSLLPAAATIVICFVSRNVLLALLLGIAAGGLLVHKMNIIDAFLIPSLGSTDYAQILLVYLWALGGLLGLWNKNGGARYFAAAAAKRFISSRVSAKVFAWILGIIFHQGGTVSTVLTGTTVRPVADQHEVAREELAYVVDSTASPIATLIPFNIWPIYIAGTIGIIPSLAGIIDNTGDAVAMFYSAIPFNFYALIAVAMTLLFSFDKLPLFGTPMQKAVDRVRNTGQLVAPDAHPLLSEELNDDKVMAGYSPSLLDFLAPISVLLGLCIVPWVLGGSPMVFEGFGLAVITALVLSIAKGMPVGVAFDAIVTGIKGVTLGAIILGLAITLAAVSKQLGASAYVIEVAVPLLETAPFILPSLLLAICMLISFSIGSSFGTYAVVFPIALPLAVVLDAHTMFVVLTFAAILGGSVFGDQCSPISDTTILSSLACGSDLMAHVNTQFPLALVAAGISGVLYLILSFLIVA